MSTVSKIKSFLYLNKFIFISRYDMMLGVTSAEGFIHLSDEELELGLETEGRNRLVSELVTSTYHVHQKEIFSAILTG